MRTTPEVVLKLGVTDKDASITRGANIRGRGDRGIRWGIGLGFNERLRGKGRRAAFSTKSC